MCASSIPSNENIFPFESHFDSYNELIAQTSKKLLQVIVVEDNFADFDDIARCLRKMICFEADVTRAKSIEEARMAFLEKQFDIAFIDFCLGHESGARLLQEIGGRSSKIVPILITGLPDERVQEIALNAGAIGCINKNDISVSLLETTIRYCLHNHRREHEYKNLLVKKKAECRI